jgi:hypothetical protein
MDDIKNEKTVVVGLLRGNSDRVTSSGSILLGSIDLENGAA